MINEKKLTGVEETKKPKSIKKAAKGSKKK